MTNKLNFKFDRDFTVVPNILLRDTRLSYKAKGIFLQIIGVPEHWEFSVKGLAALAKESTSAITSGLKELEAAGYLEWTKSRTAFNKFCVEVNVFLPEPSAVLPQAILPYGKTIDNKELNNKFNYKDFQNSSLAEDTDPEEEIWEEANQKENVVRFKRK